MSNKIKEYSKKLNYDMWADAYSVSDIVRYTKAKGYDPKKEYLEREKQLAAKLVRMFIDEDNL